MSTKPTNPTQSTKGRFAMPKQSPEFWIKALSILTLVIAAGIYFEQRFMIGVDTQKELCLPGDHRWYLIDRYDRNIRRGDIMAFRADDRVLPWFPVGQIIVKFVSGVPDDQVKVTPQGVFINGQIVSEGLKLSQTLGKKPKDFVRQNKIPQDAFWATGTNPTSFDSRYWGFVHVQQVMGKGYALPFL